jgi:hypothetical protein
MVNEPTNKLKAVMTFPKRILDLLLEQTWNSIDSQSFRCASRQAPVNRLKPCNLWSYHMQQFAVKFLEASCCKPQTANRHFVTQVLANFTTILRHPHPPALHRDKTEVNLIKLAACFMQPCFTEKQNQNNSNEFFLSSPTIQSLWS